MTTEPVAYSMIWADPHDLKLGFVGDRIQFDHRTYDRRSAEQQADYDRLREDIRSQGLCDPLITHLGHVLIGMRRCEIARDLGIVPVLCAEIEEDVHEWWDPDIERLYVLRDSLGRTEYAHDTR